MLAAHTSERIPGVESRPSPSTGGQGVAQPQQESPQREPGRACAPAVPPSSCSRDLCLPLGPLPSSGLGTFHPCTERCPAWDGVGMLLQLCSSATWKGAFPSPLSQETSQLCVTSWDKDFMAFLNVAISPAVGLQQKQHKKNFLKPLQPNITEVQCQPLHTPVLFHWYRVFS